MSAAGGPDLSLVVATLDRVEPLDRLLESVSMATSSVSVEVIVVDQNLDDRLAAIVDRNAVRLALRRVRVTPGGACAARNEGARHARSRLLGFPDDDCWFPDGTLQRVVQWFAHHPRYDILCGRTRAGDGRPSVGRWHPDPVDIVRRLVWTTSIETATFMRAGPFHTIGGFDVGLGPGAGTPFGAHEIDDLILRAIELGHRARYEPGVVVHHADTPMDDRAIRRARAFGAGQGYVLRRHGFRRGDLLTRSLRSLAGVAVALARLDSRRAHYRLLFAAGRVQGWRSSRRASRTTSP